MLKFKKLTATLVACYIINTLYSQQYTQQFSRIDITDGLSHNRVTCVYKDKNGFMWFGTIAGLNKYDGYTFKVFTHDPNDSSTLCDNYVLKLFELPRENIFILSRTKSCIYNTASQKFVSAETYFKSLGLPSAKIITITKTRNEFWFLYKDSGLYKISPSKDFYTATHINKKNRELIHHR
jgi:ligand-binding sensor domain-containing protein